MDALMQNPVTLCLGKATLAAGTTSTLSSTGTLTYCIRGKAFVRAALSNNVTPTLDATSGVAFVPILPNFGAILVIGYDALGNLKVSQGAVQPLDISGLFILSPQFPMVPDTTCPIGYEVIKAGSTASAAGFVFGTSNQAAVTGITYTLVDVVSLPDRPQVA